MAQRAVASGNVDFPRSPRAAGTMTGPRGLVRQSLHETVRLVLVRDLHELVHDHGRT